MKSPEENDRSSDERTFPVLRDERRDVPRSVPWAFIEPGRAQAMHNHSQTLERLAQRGGLCPGEFRCALEGKDLWPHFSGSAPEVIKKRGDDDAAWLVAALAKFQTERAK